MRELVIWDYLIVGFPIVHFFPCSFRFKLFLNLLFAELMGFIPVIGDIFVGWYRVNSRNVSNFEQFLAEKYGDGEDNSECCLCYCCCSKADVSDGGTSASSDG